MYRSRAIGLTSVSKQLKYADRSYSTAVRLAPVCIGGNRRAQDLLHSDLSWRVNSTRNNTQHRVVLLPEVPTDTPETNPLLRYANSGMPELAILSEENCYNGLGKALLEYESAIFRIEDSIKSGEKDWHKLLAQLEVTRTTLENVWNVVNLINIVSDKLDTDRYTILSRRAERAFLTRYNSQTIFDFINSDEVENASGEDLILLKRYKMEYKNQGYGLSENKFLELNANWMKRLTESMRDYRYKFATVTQRFRQIIRDPQVVREFPVDLLRAMSADSSQPSKGPWSVTLHPYIYRKFMEYCPDRKQRQNAYLGNVNRGNKEVDIYLHCVGHAKDVRQHRIDQAVTIGYDCYAEMSLGTKMAGTIDNVKTFISTLHGPSKTAQEIELASLQEYAESRGFEDGIREFDVDFFRRKQIRTLFGIDEESMRDFFPLPHVLKTLFALMADQYDLVFEIVKPTKSEEIPWREEVTMYKVMSKSGELKGYCYLDLYIRDDKGYNGGDRGWFIPVRSHSAVGNVTDPIGTVVMALPNPGYGKPSLMSFNEMEELFRLFGKAMAHMTAKRQWIETSGRTGVEWDALNLVPDLMSQWLLVPSMLQSLSCHWSTGESLGMNIIENQIQAAKHMPGYKMSHELLKAAYDLSFYSSEFEKEQYQFLGERMTPQYLVIEREREDSFPLNFEDMMCGNWCAGYYSHLWSRMLAADVFSAYWEAGWNNPEAINKVSKKFCSTILSAGSSRPTAELFREFRGRDPNPDALMISVGLKSSRAPKKRVS